MGIASMVIGIVALVIGFVPFCGAWAVVPAVIGLGLGIADLVVKTRRGQHRGTAVAGMVLNPLAIVVIVLWYFLFVYGATQAMEDAQWQMQQGWPQGLQGPSGWPGQPLPSGPGQPLPPDPGQPMQPMQPMQPVDTDQPPQPDTAGVQPRPVPVLPQPGPSPP